MSSTYWYPEAKTWRSLQISLFVHTNSGYIHESILAKHVEDLMSFTGIRPNRHYHPGVSGAISIVYNNKEFLGTQYWIYDFQLLGLGDSYEDFNGAENAMRITQRSDCELDVALESIGGHIVKSNFNACDFLREWQLMRGRAERIRIQLGDTSGEAEAWLASWQRGWSEEIGRSSVKQELINFTCDTDLGELLADPVPERFG